MPLLAIHFREAETPSLSADHRIVRYPHVAWYVVSPHEYSGPPPPLTDEPPESTILQVELDNPIRHMAP